MNPDTGIILLVTAIGTLVFSVVWAFWNVITTYRRLLRERPPEPKG